MASAPENEILKCCCYHKRCLDNSSKFTKVNAIQNLFFFNQEETNNSTKVVAEGCKFREAAYKLAQHIYITECSLPPMCQIAVKP